MNYLKYMYSSDPNLKTSGAPAPAFFFKTQTITTHEGLQTVATKTLEYSYRTGYMK